jgi:hypothetical protein
MKSSQGGGAGINGRCSESTEFGMEPSHISFTPIVCLQILPAKMHCLPTRLNKIYCEEPSYNSGTPSIHPA